MSSNALLQPVDWLVLGLLVLGYLVWLILRYKKRSRLKHKMAVARNKEKQAIKFLEKNGYKVIDIQPGAEMKTIVNDREYSTWIRPDLLVKKGNREYVAEVKSGAMATRITNRMTRRQLLEYYVVFGTKGILLVDMEKKRIREIEFELPNRFTQGSHCRIYQVVIGAIIVIYFFKKLGVF